MKAATMLRSALATLIAVAAIAVLPASASAAPCPVNPGNATTWIGGNGSFNDDLNWSNGGPSAACDVSISTAGSDTVTMTAGASMKSFTLGGVGSTPNLIISAQSANTNLNATTTGISIAAGTSITLTCPPSPGECNGGPTGGANLNAGSSPLTNAGTIKVDANSGTGPVITGAITNTGTMTFEKTASINGTLVNKGALTVLTGAVVTSSGSHCGDTGVWIKNDTGGTISGVGSGVLSVKNFEQGNGTTEDVQIPCGSLKYIGTGASEVLATGGFNLTGEMQENQALTISDGSNNTNAILQSDFTNKGQITFTCPAFGCNGGPGGGAGFNGNGKTFTNAGSLTVASSSGTGANLDSGSGGTIVNTGTMSFNQTARMSGVVVNKGKINIADTKVLTNPGNCGDPGAQVKNDAGGSINATGSGTFDVRNYEQGNGSTSGVNPVQLPCGSVKYTGNGASKVRAYGGFTLTGEMQAGQELTVSAESSNTNVTLGGNFTSKGTIVLTCPLLTDCSGGHGGGAGFNVNDKDFVNAGTFTVSAASGTGAGAGANFEGTITNTGTMNFDQSAGLGGPVTNKGKINIADGVVVTSSGSSCGDTGASVKNDTGGSINGTGSGYLSVRFFDQGAGTTTGTAPVFLPCAGALNYTGTGASTIVAGGTNMTGNISSGQTLRLVGQVNSGAFTNAGTIVFDQSTTNPTLNTGTVTNTGKIELVGPSANTSNVTGGLQQTGAGAEILVTAGTKLSPGAPLLLKAGTLRGSGTISGAVENTGGVVKPGASPGTLTLAGSYVQGAGGGLEIEVAGTGAGQHDVLAFSGNASLDGTLALVPTGGYAESSAVGDSVTFLTYGGSLVGQFAQATVSPSLSCPKAFATSSDSGLKTLKATVVSSGATCVAGGGNNPPPPPQKAPVPDTKLSTKPKATVKTRQAKAKVKFTFSSDVKGATFQCKLDKGAYKACSSPQTYRVKPGQHKLSVRAVGPGGTDASPATAKFKVVKQKG